MKANKKQFVFVTACKKLFKVARNSFWRAQPVPLNTRELKQRGRERQRERHKTIDSVTEYKHFTWEYNHLATFPSSSLETERENLNSGVL